MPATYLQGGKPCNQDQEKEHPDGETEKLGVPLFLLFRSLEMFVDCEVKGSLMGILFFPLIVMATSTFSHVNSARPIFYQSQMDFQRPGVQSTGLIYERRKRFSFLNFRLTSVISQSGVSENLRQKNTTLDDG